MYARRHVFLMITGCLVLVGMGYVLFLTSRLPFDSPGHSHLETDTHTHVHYHDGSRDHGHSHFGWVRLVHSHEHVHEHAHAQQQGIELGDAIEIGHAHQSDGIRVYLASVKTGAGRAELSFSACSHGVRVQVIPSNETIVAELFGMQQDAQQFLTFHKSGDHFLADCSDDSFAAGEVRTLFIQEVEIDGQKLGFRYPLR